MMEHITHGFPPLYGKDSRILIIGSMPSPLSRKQQFYYGHPQNRFWKVMAAVLHETLPETVEEKKKMILSHRIALWDALVECDIEGASDSSIRNPVPADIPWLLSESEITEIYAAGQTAWKFYQKYNYPLTGIEAVKLPSTSPANCAVSLEKLIEAYGVINAD